MNDLFFGVTERQSHDGESRWSKLTEDEAARLFEQRYN